MIRLSLENLDKKVPRMTTVLQTCFEALQKADYKVEWEQKKGMITYDALIIDPDRGPFCLKRGASDDFTK